MQNEDSGDTDDFAVTDLTALLRDAKHQAWPIREERSDRLKSYRLALGQETIQLGIIEFRILLFLASRPYHAFTRASIVAAVSSEQNPVTEDTVDRHIVSLVEQLGVF